jgi:hypothetical protein
LLAHPLESFTHFGGPGDHWHENLSPDGVGPGVEGPGVGLGGDGVGLGVGLRSILPETRPGWGSNDPQSFLASHRVAQSLVQWSFNVQHVQPVVRVHIAQHASAVGAL